MARLRKSDAERRSREAAGPDDARTTAPSEPHRVDRFTGEIVEADATVGAGGLIARSTAMARSWSDLALARAPTVAALRLCC